MLIPELETAYERLDRLLAAERAEVARLKAEVHDCPVCGVACKQCRCIEEEVAELKEELRNYRAAATAEAGFADKLNAEVAERDRQIAELRAALESLRDWEPSRSGLEDQVARLQEIAARVLAETAPKPETIPFPRSA